MKFLITGLPRMRSAWLAALFSCKHVAMYHDVNFHGGLVSALSHGTKDTIVGISDPSAASVWPREALHHFERDPIVYIERDDWRQAAKAEYPAAPDAWCDLSEKNALWFKPHAGMVIPFESLDDYSIVESIYWYCTGKKLRRQKFDLFRYLKVSQDTRRVMNIINNKKAL
jgi:hypothetical protein